MHKKVTIIAVLCLVVIAFFVVLKKPAIAPTGTPQNTLMPQATSSKTAVTILGHGFDVELALTPAQQAQGLSDRDSMAPDHGMLFIFDTKYKYPFWMKGMRFNLDMIWIAGDTIVDITNDLPAPKNAAEQPATAVPKVPVDKVLEINAGLNRQYGFKIGDRVEISTY